MHDFLYNYNNENRENSKLKFNPKISFIGASQTYTGGNKIKIPLCIKITDKEDFRNKYFKALNDLFKKEFNISSEHYERYWNYEEKREELGNLEDKNLICKLCNKLASKDKKNLKTIFTEKNIQLLKYNDDQVIVFANSENKDEISKKKTEQYNLFFNIYNVDPKVLKKLKSDDVDCKLYDSILWSKVLIDLCNYFLDEKNNFLIDEICLRDNFKQGEIETKTDAKYYFEEEKDINILYLKNLKKIRLIKHSENKQYNLWDSKLTLPGIVTYDNSEENTKPFENLDSLEEITINGFNEIPISYFNNCSKLRVVTINSSRFIKIDKWAFKDCSELKEINAPKSKYINVISEGAFYNCKKLSKIDSNITSAQFIQESAFENCLEIFGITLSDYKIDKIRKLLFHHGESDWFYQDKKIVSNNAFKECRKLEYLGLNIQSDIKLFFYGDPFNHCNFKYIYAKISDFNSLNIVDIKNKLVFYIDVDDKENHKEITRSLEDILEKNNMNTIIVNKFNDLKKINLKNTKSVEYIIIRDKKSITNNLKISPGLFSGCLNLKEIYVVQNNKKIEDRDFANDSSVRKEECPIINGVINKSNNLKSLFDDKNIILDVGDEGFLDCKNLNFGTDNCITASSIGNRSFESCSNLEQVIIKSNENKKSIGKGAFESCTNLLSVKGLNTLSDSLFKNCISLNSLDISSFSNNEINKGCFYGCSKLRYVIMSSKINKINDMAFKQCYELKSIRVINKNKSETSDSFNIKNNSNDKSETFDLSYVKNIGKEAFYSCKKVKKIKLNENINNIGSEAFSNCYELSRLAPDKIVDNINENTIVFPKVKMNKEVVIPNKVLLANKKINTVYIHNDTLKICDGAFAYCKNLKNVLVYRRLDEKFDQALCCNSLPHKIKLIGDSSFAYCSSFKGFDWLNIKCKKLDIYANAFYKTNPTKMTNKENKTAFSKNVQVKYDNYLFDESTNYHELKDTLKCHFNDSIDIKDGIEKIHEDNFKNNIISFKYDRDIEILITDKTNKSKEINDVINGFFKDENDSKVLTLILKNLSKNQKLYLKQNNEENCNKVQLINHSVLKEDQ